MLQYETFILTEDHLKLLKASYVSSRLSDCEYGAAEIDPKRPYGNSDVEGDIGEILGYQVGEEGEDWHDLEERFTNEQLEYIRKLHRETPIALQIVLCTQSFVPGTYVKSEEYNSLSWKLTRVE